MDVSNRYYWIKLKDSFLQSDAVDFLMSQENGSDYVVLYQMLCLKTINTGGRLERQIGEVIIRFDADKIARDCKYFKRDTVLIALELFKKLQLIFEEDDGSLYIINHDNLVGSESESASRKRLLRTNHGQNEDKSGTISGQCPDNVTEMSQECPENVTVDIRDKILDIRVDRRQTINNSAGAREVIHNSDSFIKSLIDTIQSGYIKTGVDWLKTQASNKETWPRIKLLLKTLAEVLIDNDFPIEETKKITPEIFCKLYEKSDYIFSTNTQSPHAYIFELWKKETSKKC